MCRLSRVVFLMAFIAFVTQYSKMLVESKALLCHPPPKWTVDNGSDPMAQSTGNVTLVTLINASYRFGLKQASSLENMLRFLRKSGLKDINFIVINSKDMDAKQKFKELSQKVTFGLYQETEEELVWNVLDGGKDDMFIYDRFVISFSLLILLDICLFFIQIIAKQFLTHFVVISSYQQLWSFDLLHTFPLEHNPRPATYTAGRPPLNLF